MPSIGKGIWGSILKRAKKSAVSDADRAIGMLDDIAKDNPDLRSAIGWIKGKLKTGDYTPEQAKRAENTLERASMASKAPADMTGTGTLADYGAARASAEGSMGARKARELDERITDFNWDDAVSNPNRNARRADAEAADYVHNNRTAAHTADGDGFDKAIDERREYYLGGGGRENTERALRRSAAGLEGNVIEDFNNAVKSGLSVQEAAEEVAKNSLDKYGYELEFNDVIETARKAGKID